MFNHAMQPVASSSPPRSEVSLPRLRFPILTLEERSLTPALGYVFDKKWLEPYESIVSILWKFKTANALPGYALARLMGPRVDPYEGVAPQPEAIELERLRSTLDLPAKTLRAALLPALQHRPRSDSFRYCRRCIACGYHSALYQIDRVMVCPAHSLPLEAACRVCGYEAPYLLNVRLLETPYRCADCGARYGSRKWSPDRLEPMSGEHRRAITRVYIERGLL
jgi:DNA-directed RNA polymerase subunit RPC12/RpoP